MPDLLLEKRRHTLRVAEMNDPEVIIPFQSPTLGQKTLAQIRVFAGRKCFVEATQRTKRRRSYRQIPRRNVPGDRTAVSCRVTQVRSSQCGSGGRTYGRPTTSVVPSENARSIRRR